MRRTDIIAITGTLALIILAPFVYSAPLFTPRRTVNSPFSGQLNNNLGVDGGAYFSRDVRIQGTLNVNGSTGFDAGVTVAGNLRVDGDAYSANWRLYQDGSFLISNDTFDILFADGTTGYLGVGKLLPAYPLDVTGNTRIVGNATVTGDIGAATVDAGVVRAPAITVASTASVPRCGTDVSYGTKMRFSGRTYECSEAATARGFPAGSWLVESLNGAPVCAQSPADVVGPATTSGIEYGTTPSGEGYFGVRKLYARVFAAGTCTACGATNSVLDILQRNHMDGGYHVAGTAVIPCTAPANFCVEACPTCPGNARLANGCDSDAGIAALIGPESIYGAPSFEFRADGGQCTKNPGVRVCVDGVSGFIPDGGGLGG